jgi:hypothetical protein
MLREMAASDAHYCAPTSLDWPAPNGNPAGTCWIGAGLRSPRCVHMRQSEWVGGREGNADTSAGAPGKEKPRHTHPPCSLWRSFSGGLISWEIAQKGFEPPSRQSATRARNGSCAWLPGDGLPKVLRPAHTQ